jgi:homoserine O-acetyltransferase/O-succinyltransferase
MSQVRREVLTGVTLPSGRRLERVELPYTLSGVPAPDGSNVAVLLHSLTGGIHPETWWPTLVRPGGVLDPGRWALLTPALYGGGACPWEGEPGEGGTTVPRDGNAPEPEETGPAPAGARTSPPPTLRDAVHLVGALLDRMGIGCPRLVTGGSVGGMVALEWAATFPDRARSVVVFAAPAAHTAHGIAFNRVQRRALELGGDEAGLALAREIAMLTYRTPDELESRFGRERRADGVFQVASWLEHHGRKLVARLDPAAYRRLLHAMDTHDVGAGRGGTGAALRRFAGRLVGVGIEGDLLYPPGEVNRWVEAAGGEYRELRSIHGHDAFLLEEAQVAGILEEAVAAPGRRLRLDGRVA